jgi:hypothetical protein
MASIASCCAGVGVSGGGVPCPARERVADALAVFHAHEAALAQSAQHRIADVVLLAQHREGHRAAQGLEQLEQLALPGTAAEQRFALEQAGDMVAEHGELLRGTGGSRIRRLHLERDHALLREPVHRVPDLPAELPLQRGDEPRAAVPLEPLHDGLRQARPPRLPRRRA